MKLSTTALVVASFVAGLALSDVATYTGFPGQMHLLELKYDGTAVSAYSCALRANYYGLNLSDFDRTTNSQKNCHIRAVGRFDELGNFYSTPGWFTWVGRIRGYVQPTKIPATDIEGRGAR
jgi:hypothetical protein